MTLSASTPSDTPLLLARGVVKTFPGVRALDAVDFTLRRGEIHSLMGENGAGKSTLIKVLTGVYPKDGGEMLLDGQLIHPRSPLDAQKLGISTVYQEVNLVPFLSVAENIYLGRQPKRLGFIRWGEINRGAREALARLDLEVDVTRPLNSYSIAVQQLVAIARALDVRAKVLILDEPTSSLTAKEVERLFDVMRRLKERGLGIVFVTHFLDQVYAVSDRITVLRNGRFVGEYEPSKLPRFELIARMLGRDADAVERLTHRHADACAANPSTLVDARALGRTGSIKPIDLQIRAGEIVGLAGLLGSGRSEVARLLFGVDRADSGQMLVDGRPADVRSPRTAIALRFGLTPEDRKTDGIIPDLSIRENIALALQGRRGWLRPLSRAAQNQLADRYIKALGIATPDADKPIGQLSGGNQQKALLARWLASEPRLLIVDEPTRGIDVGAKAEIEKLLASLCKDGMAILFISSELEEVARDCHRVVVLRDRSKIGELTGDRRTVPNIMRLIAGEAAS
jgi:galactofuranose transport system ATP-binding protein